MAPAQLASGNGGVLCLFCNMAPRVSLHIRVGFMLLDFDSYAVTVTQTNHAIEVFIRTRICVCRIFYLFVVQLIFIEIFPYLLSLLLIE